MRGASRYAIIRACFAWIVSEAKNTPQESQEQMQEEQILKRTKEQRVGLSAPNFPQHHYPALQLYFRLRLQSCTSLT